MMQLIYAPSFVRRFKKLEPALQDEVIEKLALFQKAEDHPQLKVHKLKGPYKNCYGFSVNYSFRIIFEYGKGDQIHILDVSDHDLYR